MRKPAFAQISEYRKGWNAISTGRKFQDLIKNFFESEFKMHSNKVYIIRGFMKAMDSFLFIRSAFLKEHLKEYVVIDCRYRLTDKDFGINAFHNEHISGAFFVDLNTDMASPVKEVGGRHPLPDFDKLRSRLESYGISNSSEVVCYDDNLSGAARMYLLLEMLGIQSINILEGGFEEWKSLGYPTERGKGNSQEKHGTISGPIKTNMIVDHKDILFRDNFKVIDAREKYRYLGENEPIDKFPGRIPKSINVPYLDLMDGVGLKDKNDLIGILSDFGDGDAVYCGSGVTSCIIYIAAKLIGKNPKIYVGSYSDWISRGLPIETGP